MKSRFVFHIFLAALIVTGAFFGLPAKQVEAASMVVTTSADETTQNGRCSLREAITNANNNNQGRLDCAAGSGADTITFSSAVTTPITLSSTLPAITDAAGLSIDGGGAVHISGGGTVRIMRVNTGASLTLTGLTIENGLATTSGDNFGGGVYNLGTLTVTNSRFDTNTAGGGGAILSNGGATTISGSTFTGNTGLEGGGAVIFITGGTHTVTTSLFEGNIAFNSTNQHGSGAGLQAQDGTTVNITNTTFYNNQANGASDDGGGGLMVYGGTVTVTNSTFSNNSSATQGGGVRQYGGMVTLRNTIIANSAGGGNCAGTITDGGGNLVWGDTSCPGTNGNPVLQALASNGGSTQSMALGTGSAATNRASSANCPSTDQRGFSRRSGACDTGAFEA